MDGSIDALLDVDRARADHDGRLDLLIGLEPARAALNPQAQQALAALAGEGDAEQQAKEWAREEVAAALRIAPVTAGVRLHDASALVERLPRPPAGRRVAEPGPRAGADRGHRRLDEVSGINTRWQGRRPGVEVSVALSTLLGLDDQPGELTGHGPIPHISDAPSGTDPPPF